jgi:hypothetical protein
MQTVVGYGTSTIPEGEWIRCRVDLLRGQGDLTRESRIDGRPFVLVTIEHIDHRVDKVIFLDKNIRLS